MDDHQNPQDDAANTTDHAEWFAELSESAVPSAGAVELPELLRARPARPPLVPRGFWFAVGGSIVALALIIAAVAVTITLTRVAMPDVVGQPLGDARTQLGRLGLKVTVTERRFSDLPQDQVIEQLPAAGAQARKGDVVQLVVSAGSEEFQLPDVVNQQVTVARGSLESRGLVVIVDQVVSAIASGTVLMSTPSAGTTVRTGDTVRLQVAVTDASGQSLKPYTLDGVRFIVDAAPMSGNGLDPSLEVARRLRALLEASGAQVTMLRSSLSTQTTDAERARVAAQAGATAAIGFTVAPTGTQGRIVYVPAVGSVGAAPAASSMASGIAQALQGVAPPTTQASSTTDLVLQSSLAPWTRVSLGSLEARVDRNAFADPTWSDNVARAIYEVLGRQFGTATQ